MALAPAALSPFGTRSEVRLARGEGERRAVFPRQTAAPETPMPTSGEDLERKETPMGGATMTGLQVLAHQRPRHSTTLMEWVV